MRPHATAAAESVGRVAPTGGRASLALEGSCAKARGARPRTTTPAIIQNDREPVMRSSLFEAPSFHRPRGRASGGYRFVMSHETPPAAGT